MFLGLRIDDDRRRLAIDQGARVFTPIDHHFLPLLRPSIATTILTPTIKMISVTNAFTTFEAAIFTS